MKEFIDKKSRVVNVSSDTFLKNEKDEFANDNFSGADYNTQRFTKQEDDNEYFDNTVHMINNSLIPILFLINL